MFNQPEAIPCTVLVYFVGRAQAISWTNREYCATSASHHVGRVGWYSCCVHAGDLTDETSVNHFMHSTSDLRE